MCALACVPLYWCVFEALCVFVGRGLCWPQLYQQWPQLRGVVLLLMLHRHQPLGLVA